MVISASNNFLCHRKSILKSDPKGQQFAFAEDILLKILSSRVESKASFFFSMFIQTLSKKSNSILSKIFFVTNPSLDPCLFGFEPFRNPFQRKAIKNFHCLIKSILESNPKQLLLFHVRILSRFLSSLRKGKQFFVKKLPKLPKILFTYSTNSF